MGCGNSTQTSTANNHSNSSSKTGHPDCASDMPDDSAADDDKRKDYGGVYVGLPANISTVQIGSLQESERDSSSLRKPLWGNGLSF